MVPIDDSPDTPHLLEIIPVTRPSSCLMDHSSNVTSTQYAVLFPAHSLALLKSQDEATLKMSRVSVMYQWQRGILFIQVQLKEMNQYFQSESEHSRYHTGLNSMITMT